MRSISDNATLYYTELRDVELAELVELFVQELPLRLNAVERAAHGGCWAEVRSLAHQIKGASGSYGFPQLMSAAASLEQAIRESGSEAEVHAALQQLTLIASLTRSGVPQA